MKVYVSKLGRGGYNECIDAGFRFLDFRIPTGSRICIKPNLTFPTFRKGVMTNPKALEAIVTYLKNFTDHITICESDSGGYNRFSMDEVFATTGISAFAKRHAVTVVNMSHCPARFIEFRSHLRRFSVPLAAFLLDETDLFITMPVPKVHANTIVSLSLKNQWGLIQEPAKRLKLHPYFNEVIYRINKALPPSLSLLDGKYGLTRNGPMRGDFLELDWFVLGDNLFAVDYIVSRMMGFDPRAIPHLQYAFHRERFNVAEMTLSTLEEIKSSEFFLRRDWTDYPGLFAFHSRLLAYVGYESVLARPLHWLLYKFREPFY